MSTWTESNVSWLLSWCFMELSAQIGYTYIHTCIHAYMHTYIYRRCLLFCWTVYIHVMVLASNWSTPVKMFWSSIQHRVVLLDKLLSNNMCTWCRLHCVFSDTLLGTSTHTVTLTSGFQYLHHWHSGP